jgi:transposase-like protein
LELVEQWSDSGESQVGFAERHSLKLATFRYWVVKWREHGGGKSAEAGRFVDIRTNSSGLPESWPNAGVIVRLGDVVVQCDRLPSVEWLRELAGRPC